MNQVIKDLDDIMRGNPWDTRHKLEAYIARLKAMPKEDKKQRSKPQNNSLHLDCKLIADKLNDMGLYVNKIIRVDIDWDTLSVKKHIVKPIMKSMYGYKSTKQLKKNDGRIEKLHEVIMRELGEKHQVEYHPFPSKTVVTKENDYLNDANSLRNSIEYPNE